MGWPLLLRLPGTDQAHIRSRIRAQQDQARALRSAIRALRTTPITGDGSGLAMFLDVALLVVTAAAHWHQLRQHDQQVAAAHQTLTHLQTAYQQAARTPLAALAQRQPPARTVERHAKQIRTVVPDYAEEVLEDPAWAGLATALTEAETAGHDPERLLQHVARQRTLDDAHSAAQVLTWRILRLSQRQAPSARARAAQNRSTMRSVPSPAEVSPARTMQGWPAPRGPRR